jgi:hypothetical protein
MPWNKQHSAVANSSCAVVGIARGPVHCHRKLARCVGFAVLAACAGASLGAGLTGQGIYPGDPDANAIKLPGDFEAVIRPRMFYKNTDTLTGGEQEAWVIGGLAGLRSPWVADLFQFGAVGYISQKLSGPAGKGGHAAAAAGPVFDLCAGRGLGRPPRRGTDDHRLPPAH